LQVTVNKPDVDLCGEEPKRHNANRTREHRYRNGQKGQVDLHAEGTLEQVAYQKTADEENTSGMNGTAFPGDLDADNRKPEVDPGPEYWHYGQSERCVSSLGRSSLQ
jgi:hypothetical protein